MHTPLQIKFNYGGFIPESIWHRAILTYVFISVGALFLYWAMIDLGDASPDNPSWRLVAGIYGAFKWSWYAIAASVGIAGGLRGASYVISFYQERVRLQQMLAEIELRKAQTALDQKKWARSRALDLQKHQRKKRRAIQDRHRWNKERRELIRRRTAREAVEVATREFCIGG